MNLSDISHALATLGVESPHIYYSTDNDALLSATYYHPDRLGERWVFRALRREQCGIEIIPLYQTRPGDHKPMNPTEFRHGLATYAITAPQIYYSTATEALLSATCYHPRQRGDRWVMRLVYGEAGGLEVRPLYQIWAEYGEVEEAQH